MTLTSGVTALATAVRDKINIMAPRLTPIGGTTGQVLAKNSATNYDTGWTTVQAFDAGLQSIAGLTTAADRMIYTTASDTYAVATLTAAGRALIDDASAAAQRTTLGLGTAATTASTAYATAAQGTSATTAFGWGNHALAGYLTSVSWGAVTGKPTFATVATTGAYSDLSGLPTLFNGAYASLSGLPALGTASAASTGDFATAAQGTLAGTALQPATIGVTVQGYDVDTLKSDVTTNLTAAYTAAVDDDGTKTTGTYTPTTAAGSNYKKIINGGAFTLSPPTLATGQATTISLFITNNGTAGAITTTGFSKVSGDAFSVVSGDDFLCRIEVFDIGGTEYSLLNVVAMQ